MFPVIRQCEQRSVPYSIIHTGQHYSYDMGKVFFNDLEIPSAKFNLEFGSGTHGDQTGRVLAAIEHILLEHGTNIVLVQGNTNTVLAELLSL
jgi:UDP-N-acetylglucosamine 2-epimerase (non-hydrolysing)